MRLLLIGATGQIGFALTNALSKTPHHTSVLVRDARKLPMPANVQVREAKTFTPEAFEEALYDVDGVIYGVGVPLQPTLDNQMWERLNFGSLKTFLEVLGRSTCPPLDLCLDGGSPESGQWCGPRDPSARRPQERLALLPGHAPRVSDGEDLGGRDEHGSDDDPSCSALRGLEHRVRLEQLHGELAQPPVRKVPMIVDARFPVVHAESLASAIVAALAKPGAFLVSDEMTSLKEIRAHAAQSRVTLTCRRWSQSGWHVRAR